MAGFGLPNFGQLTEAFRKAQQRRRPRKHLAVGKSTALAREA